MGGKIRLNRMVFYGYHGVDESEQARGGMFEVDMEMTFRMEKAFRSDNLADTIDYRKVYATVHNCLTDRKHYLLESLAERIADSALKEFALEEVRVVVRKPHAPVRGVLESVEVEVLKSRNE